MRLKAVSGTILTLLFIGMLALAFNIQPAKADSETIYIRPDGSIYPPTAPIQHVGNTYTLTANIYDSIVVERNDIVIDGAGYTLQGSGADGSKGVDLTGRSNVTIKNTEITAFCHGILLSGSSNNIVSGNNITANSAGINSGSSNYNQIYGNSITANDWFGIWLSKSSYNNISRNSITANNGPAIWLGFSSNYNSIYGNSITAHKGTNAAGVLLESSNNNSVSENNITNNSNGIRLVSSNNIIYGNNITNNSNGIFLIESSNNKFYHNNFNNTQDAYDLSWDYPELYSPSILNVWDDGYPSGGNFWSDYVESYPDAEQLDGSGLWDTPYVIDEFNQDNYPLMNPWTTLPPAPPSKFSIGDWVQATVKINVREGPGLRYTIISTMPQGTIGQILGGPVEADGYVWWDVDYAVGVRGWSVENWLELGPPPTEEPRFLTLPFKDSNILVGWVFDPSSEPPHYGIDFIKSSDISDSSTWQSFDVVSSAEGEAFWNEQYETPETGWGKYVYIRHTTKDAEDRNYYTLYAHLQSIDPKIPREWNGSYKIGRGELIGRAGATGVEDPSLIHLHFEAHRGDARSYGKRDYRVDPYDLNQPRGSHYGEKATSIRCGPNHLWISDPPTVALFGDLNNDRIVDIFDVVSLTMAFGSTSDDSDWNIAADLNKDDIVDIFDVVLLVQNFGKTA